MNTRLYFRSASDDAEFEKPLRFRQRPRPRPRFYTLEDEAEESEESSASKDLAVSPGQAAPPAV